MALQYDHTMFFTNELVEDVYFKILWARIHKEGESFLVDVRCGIWSEKSSADKGDPMLAIADHSLVYDINDTRNVWQQAYDYLKTESIYSDATNV